MEHTISRNNAQYIYCTACALLRNVKLIGYNWINKRVKA
jgi:ribosomal protein L37E